MGISYVVPVFNTSPNKFENCIASIEGFNEKNKITDYEIIVVNDGSSTTKTANYENFLNKKKNIIYIKNKNHGVSYSRNVGIERATKQYITFVDSDDSLLFKKIHIKNIKADLIIFDIAIVSKNKVKSFDLPHGKVASKNALIEHLAKTSFAEPVAKFYNKTFLEENNLHFNTNFLQGEDALFNLMALAQMPSIYYCAKTIYAYNFNSSSTTKRWNEHFNKVSDNIKEIYFKKIDVLKSSNIKNKNEILKKINQRQVVMSFKIYITLIKIGNEQKIKRFVKQFMAYDIKKEQLSFRQKIYYQLLKTNLAPTRSIIRTAYWLKNHH